MPAGMSEPAQGATRTAPGAQPSIHDMLTRAAHAPANEKVADTQALPTARLPAAQQCMTHTSRRTEPSRERPRATDPMQRARARAGPDCGADDRDGPGHGRRPVQL